MAPLILRQFACDTRKARLRSAPRKAKRGFDLISDALRFSGLRYAEPDAIGYPKFCSRLHVAVIHVYDPVSGVIDRVGLFGIRRISDVCYLFAFAHHRHELFFDGGGSFHRAQAKRECFM